MIRKNLKLSSNKVFGLFFFVIFIAIALYPLLASNPLNTWSFFVAAFFLIFGLTKTNILTPLNILWYKLGILLGTLISPIVMAAIFFLVVTPISLIMKILRKDLLNLTTNKDKSYWIEKEKIKSSMNNQF